MHSKHIVVSHYIVVSSAGKHFGHFTQLVNVFGVQLKISTKGIISVPPGHRYPRYRGDASSLLKF